VEDTNGSRRHSPRSSTLGDPEDQERQHDEYAHDQGSDDDLDDDEDDVTDESYDALEERFHGLEVKVADLVAEVHDLALYSKLNLTAFMKILKVSFALQMKLNRIVKPCRSFTQKHDVSH
jgi:SPX domain protein involved in polyphosphate accumulation